MLSTIRLLQETAWLASLASALALYSSDNNILDNIMTEGSSSGITLTNSAEDNIRNNQIRDYLRGISLSESTGNLLARAWDVYYYFRNE